MNFVTRHEFKVWIEQPHMWIHNAPQLVTDCVKTRVFDDPDAGELWVKLECHSLNQRYKDEHDKRYSYGAERDRHPFRIWYTKQEIQQITE